MGSGVISTLSEDADIRLRRREEVDVLVSRMGLLRAQDRALLEMQVTHACTYKQLSRLCGLSAQQVARRIKGLIRRLIGQDYITIYRHKERFSESQMEVAYDRYLLGLGYRKIAGKRGIEAHRVRRILGELRGFLRDQQD